MEDVKHDKNIELAEKQKLQIEFEENRNKQKKELLDHEHKLKMERLEKRLKIAEITGKDIDES